MKEMLGYQMDEVAAALTHERRPNNFRVVKFTISESQVSFELKVKRCIE